MLFIVTVLPATGAIEVDKNKHISAAMDDELDQNQSQYDENPPGAIWNYSVFRNQWVTQTFKPSLGTLTRIELFMHKTTDDEAADFFVRIEDNEGNYLGWSAKRSNETPLGYSWVEFDFETDIKLNVGETYYIVCNSYCDPMNCYAIAFGTNTNYTRGTLLISTDQGRTWESQIDEDLCFKTYGKVEQEPEPDLECLGTLSWIDAKPGAMVTGQFYVMNVGEYDSELNWEINEYPDWGVWSFSPEEGSGLTPTTDPIEVRVSVIIPDKQEQTFTGEIKIVNKDDNGDFYKISVSLTTPKNKQPIESLFHQFIWRFIDHFPLLQVLHLFSFQQNIKSLEYLIPFIFAGV